MTERRPSLLGRPSRDESARPPRVSPLNAALLTVGVDIGGTKVVAGVVTHEGEIVDQVRRDTPDRSKSPQVVEDTIVDAVLDLATRHDVHAVGIGAAGFIDADRANVLFAPHLSWRNEPLRDAISSRLRLPVVVENDANAAVWAEWRFGAGRGESHLVCVNLGTGIGGAMIVNGALQRGRFGVAGEYGHMQVVPDGRRCECGNRGCWEQYASGNVLVREARELAAVRLAGRARPAGALRRGPGRHHRAARDRGAPATATRRRASCSWRSGTGSASASPTSPPPSTRGRSSSAAVCLRRATC